MLLLIQTIRHPRKKEKSQPDEASRTIEDTSKCNLTSGKKPDE